MSDLSSLMAFEIDPCVTAYVLGIKKTLEVFEQELKRSGHGDIAYDRAKMFLSDTIDELGD